MSTYINHLATHRHPLSRIQLLDWAVLGLLDFL